MLPAPAHRIQIDYMLPSHQPTGQGNYPIQPLNYPLGGPPPMMNTPQSVMNYAGKQMKHLSNEFDYEKYDDIIVRKAFKLLIVK